jgi:hypothetical protein
LSTEGPTLPARKKVDLRVATSAWVLLKNKRTLTFRGWCDSNSLFCPPPRLTFNLREICIQYTRTEARFLNIRSTFNEVWH